ncbi:aldolase/citrate lyase family protein [Ferruginibacter sp. HRS2-29]|uniref:aldolase/citrate lyase family protein n=1 Tax=Ferruginibacter sp. HRS2-29 TaxID=2487334 RepID=UPI0020CCBE10|nr:aldolase/citrate lyase family protein [Ferruginibacter sp. HRS2-29]MCP9750959.1 citrate lyase subunit gamma [Ferruginibacter sp. HRS2-29]
MEIQIATAGNKGEKVRSDCFVFIELTSAAGIRIELESKVKALYGPAITSLCHEVLACFDIKNALVKIEDKGALDFVIAARLEAAIKQLVHTDKAFLTPLLPENEQPTSKEKFRTSRLFIPGNTPGLMINAGAHQPDAIILDLEDAVAPAKKEEARFLVRNTLRSLAFMGAERMVRINQLPMGLNDLDHIIPHHVNMVMLPKCESAEQVHQVNERIRQVQKAHGHEHPVWLMPIIESAMGVIKTFEIATAADNVAAIAIGLEDYTADIGVTRTKEGNESFYARSQLVNACKAAGIQAIDSIFSDVADLEALRENALRSRAMGFDGMGCIHPRQIKVVHECFAPQEHEVETALTIIKAFDEAVEKGHAVFAIGNKMIDAPVVKRARRVIELAGRMGKINL